MQRTIHVIVGLAWLSLLGGCFDQIRNSDDQRVYELIEDRQRSSLRLPRNVRIDDPVILEGDTDSGADMYSFTPRPVPRDLPSSFSVKLPVEESGSGSDSDAVGDSDSSGDAFNREVMDPTVFRPEERDQVKLFSLREAIQYALRHGRDLQNAKEDLFLAGLDLTLERHLWTPQFSASVRADYANYGQIRDFDHAMSAVAEAAVSQRLPLGGEITARVIGSLMRDLGQQVTTGESGTAILAADIPLLRGAGEVAYEPRYVAERELIYAVRSYERFRRSFMVSVANEFFDLQVLKASIANTYGSYLARHSSWEKADFIAKLGRSTNISDSTRALSNLRSAEVSLVARKEQYASALDRFKVRIGMPVDEPLDVVEQAEDETVSAIEGLLPDIDEGAAIEVALRYRLDLLTTADGIDDARRGVVIAKNRILPDLDLSGSLTMDTDPNRKNVTAYNTERSTWRAGINLQTDDRMTEKTAYRRSLVTVRRSERSYDQAADSVRADVRRALRQIDRNADVRAIQASNVDENTLRRDASQAQYDLGKASNQNVIDAENELLTAQDSLATAIADFRSAILVFRLDTGTLFVSDDGRWENPGVFAENTP